MKKEVCNSGITFKEFLFKILKRLNLYILGVEQVHLFLSRNTKDFISLFNIKHSFKNSHQ